MSLKIGKIATWSGALACIAAAAMFASGKAGDTAPTDPQIVGIVVTANQIDIDAGQLALKKAKSEEVRDFAQQMVTDHSALQKSVSDLGANLKVKPEDSDTSRSLKSQAEETTRKLETLQGAAFDKAYLDNEANSHQAVINATSSVLIPNAQNAELKKALQNAAPLFQGHLEHARKVQSELGSEQ
jgi:putative membrane protein